MALEFREIHPSSTSELLNEEWFTIENTGANPVSTQGCVMTHAHGKGRGAIIGTLDPGFTLKPGEADTTWSFEAKGASPVTQKFQSGTATTPLMTAVQNSAFIGLMWRKFCSAPSAVAMAMTA